MGYSIMLGSRWTFPILLIYLFRDLYASKQTSIKRTKRYGCFHIFRTVFPCIFSKADQDEKTEEEISFHEQDQKSALLDHKGEYDSYQNISKSYGAAQGTIEAFGGAVVGLAGHRDRDKEKFTIQSKKVDFVSLNNNQDDGQSVIEDFELISDEENALKAVNEQFKIESEKKNFEVDEQDDDQSNNTQFKPIVDVEEDVLNPTKEQFLIESEKMNLEVDKQNDDQIDIDLKSAEDAEEDDSKETKENFTIETEKVPYKLDNDQTAEFELIENAEDVCVGLGESDYDEAFVVACATGDIKIVKLILGQERLDPSANGNKAIIAALKYCHDDIVVLILEDPRFLTDSSVEFLLELIVNIKSKSISHEDIASLNPEVFDFLLLRLVHEGYSGIENIKRFVVWKSLRLRTMKGYELLRDKELLGMSAVDLRQLIDSFEFKSKL